MRKLIALMLVLLLCGCGAAENANVPEEPAVDETIERRMLYSLRRKRNFRMP